MRNFAILFAQGILMFGQIEGGLSPFPAWPTAGTPDLNRYPQGTYVFHDARTDDYVAYYPESLFRSGSRSKAFQTVRIHVQNKAKAVVSTRIIRGADGVYFYDYTVKNLKVSTEPLDAWFLVAESNDESLALAHSSWKMYGESPAKAAAKLGLSWDGQRRGPAPFRMLMFSSRTSGAPVVPGASLGGFRITSQFKPGLTKAYFSGGPSPTLGGPLPEPVMRQVERVLDKETNWRTDTVIGPRFGPERTALWVASDWHAGLQRLVAARKLDANSPFVIDLLGEMSALVQKETAKAASGDSKSPYRISVRNPPRSPLEFEILAAIRACFE